MPRHPFLTAAETRAAHLRELNHHMTALELRTVSRADVQREIPELEAAMAVYRRLSADDPAPTPAIPVTTATAASKPRTPKRAPGTTTPAAAPRRRRSRRAAEPPSFKEFALTQLDTLAQVAGDSATEPAAPQRSLA